MEKKVSTISQRLKDALEIRHMTAAELSRLTGVKESDLSHYKKGDYEPASKNLEKIANALRVSIPWLMGYEVEMEERTESKDEFRQEMFDEDHVLFDYTRLSDESKKTVRSIINALKAQENNSNP